jgi:eukaryotic-like serine/threonine-protein kinase
MGLSSRTFSRLASNRRNDPCWSCLQPMLPGSKSRCLEDSDILALLDGRLPDAQVHLDGCDVCRRTVAESVRPMRASIGRYQPVELLGRGGMAVVFRAYDPELRRPVALKMLSATDDVRARERLAREAQVLAQLPHPNIVRVFDVGVANGDVFIAMELLHGATFDAWLAHTRPSRRRIIAVLIGIGHGLAAAHNAGLVHRDVKPSNVIVDGDDHPRLIDFGLARVSSTSGDPASVGPTALASSVNLQLTHHGARVGTPAYMAPEQHDGVEVTTATDQFGFCVIAYEALYGQRPFRGRSAAELRSAIAGGLPPPIGRASSRRVHRALVRGLAELPANRFPSMEELLAELAPPRRAARAVIAATVFTLAGAIVALNHSPAVGPNCDVSGELVGAWDAQRITAINATLQGDTARRLIERLDTYADQWRDGRRDACEATHLRGVQSERVLDRRLACLDHARAALGDLVDELIGHPEVADHAVDAVAALPDLDRCSDHDALATQLPDPSESPAVRELMAELRHVEVLRSTGQYDRGLARAREVLSRAEVAGMSHLAARAHYWIGSLRAHAGQHGGAAADLEAAVADGDDETVARALVELVKVGGTDAARDDAGRAFAVAADAAIDRAGDPWRLRAQLQLNLGALATEHGRFAEAEGHLRDALALFEERAGADSPEVATALSNLGNALDGLGDLEDARVVLERALALRRRLLGDRHPYVAATLTNLANTVRKLGDHELAFVYLEESLALARAALGDHHVGVAITLANLGDTLRDLGRSSEAVGRFGEALEIATAVLPTDHPMLGRLRGRRGTAALEAGDVASARQDLEAALAQLDRGGINDPAVIADVAFPLARALGRRDPRAAQLAARARGAYGSQSSPSSVRSIAEIDSWLDQ